MEKQHQMLKETQEEKNNEGKIDEQQIKHHVQQLNPSSCSSSSSPSHEFSFTISLHPTATKIPENTNKSLAIDLSPADEIFFHGHLLPLHLLSHLQSISPRSSTNSLDNFTLPIKEIPENNPTSQNHQENNPFEGNVRRKSKPFSLFGLPRWIKRDDIDSRHQGQKRKFKFDVGCVVKRYMRLVKPYLSSLRNKKRDFEFDHNYSFSTNLRVKNKKHEYFSAPASMSISPTNSGLLVASGNVTPNTKSTDSTMEELQAAIQAAIAHCKNSIAKDDKINLP